MAEQSLIVYYGLLESNLTQADINEISNLGEYCIIDHNCSTLNCNNNVCIQNEFDSVSNLADYVNSDDYNKSFMYQHILTWGVGQYANYQNLYPIMESNFCYTVGNLSEFPDCNLIDFDALLLGNCWGHPCLPNYLHCRNGGSVCYISTKGYECVCPDIYEGDECHILKVNRTYDKKTIKENYQKFGCCEKDCTITI